MAPAWSAAFRWRVAALLTVLAVLAGACGTGPPDHVRIGVVAPLTGPRAYLGQEVANGVRLAVEQLNDEGGLLGRDVELVLTDDADLVDLPGELADLAERSRVTAVIGPEAPGILLGPRSPLSRRDVPALLATAFGGNLDRADTLVVRTIPSARAQGETLGHWFHAVRHIDRVAVLLADPVEGVTVRDALLDGLRAGGVTVQATVEAAGDAGRLGPSVAALRRDAPDAQAVVLWGPPPTAARATLAVRDQGWDVQLAVPASSFVAEYRSLAGDASEGVVLAFPFREDWFGPRMMTWMLRYYAANGMSALPQLDTLVLDVPVVAIAASDAVGLVAAAVRQAGSRVPDAVSRALTGVTFDGLLRTYRLDDREAWSPSDLYVARFHHYATVFDVDPRLDAAQQRTFWRYQVDADYLPPEVLNGPAGPMITRMLGARRQNPPTYQTPLPPPGPVGRPGEGTAGTGDG